MCSTVWRRKNEIAWLRLPYHEVKNLVLDGILIPELGEPIQFHLAASVQRYCVYLRLKALSRHLA
jgi:hypothetical protein